MVHMAQIGPGRRARQGRAPRRQAIVIYGESDGSGHRCPGDTAADGPAAPATVARPALAVAAKGA